MGKISEHVFRVVNSASLAGWYKTVMGMQVTEDASAKTWTAFYPGEGVKLVFQEVASKGTTYKSNRDSCYWKIGVTVSDVDLAREKIMAAGTQVSVPNQFLDVGYLCHLADPNGFTIELLQHTFKQNFVKPIPDPSLALGQTAVIGQITTRSQDIEASLGLYRDSLGMKLLSIQDISDYGFCLYFLAFTAENPPDQDLASTKNREWLWQRPYTTLEIQCRPGQKCVPMDKEGEGVDHITMEVEDYANIMTKLKADQSATSFQDPDGVQLKLQSASS
eukprot:GFUD01008857.1.p1 GENE.GFUD01008857.1~~GFUD01008857.1.p1  ORF type:complete len:276 (-),score=95.18 GFUD01008857.1:141-968(-)